ncbi:MAG TPA: polysaccharide biosynthesis tyrosine autokinase [Opitutaceae bacterium]|jgi:succinoglycan biosynthesis transport protein ExoP|nr:polysaccharide biosynthesis tyrosine autokinase [Opitutaceae bacterium]
MAENPQKNYGSSASGHYGRDEPAVERRSIRDYYIILRERLWIALPLALLLSVGLGYFQARETPMFSATATMQFEKGERIVEAQQVVDPTVTSEIDLNTNLRLLESTRLKSRVANSFTPEEVKILQAPYIKDLKAGATPPAVGDCLGILAVQSIRNSYLISITVAHESAEASALIANRYVDQFMQDLLERVGGSNEYAVVYLRAMAEQLRKDSEAAQQRLLAYMKEHNLVSLDSSANIVTERLRSVNTALQAARLERLTIEQLFNQVEAHKAAGRDLLEISFIASHGSVPGIRDHLSELTRTESILSERYLERHPKIIDIAHAIRVSKGQLETAIAQAVRDLASTLEKAKAQEASLGAEYAKQEAAQLHLRDISVDFRTLENQANVASLNYTQILNRLTETSTSKSLEKFPVRPLDRAFVPAAPYTPNLQRIARNSAGIFVLVFFGVAFGLSLIDDRIKSAWDVETFIGANLLGIIPELNGIKDDEKYTMVLDNKQSPGMEAFLSVYSSVKIHSKLDFPKTILVTSTIPGEGKTLVSCNLAGSFAKHAKSTLLVDCDLRRPMLHRHFKQTNETGLLSWFQNGAQLDGDLLANPHLGITKVGENLWLLCSGGRSKSPTELLDNPVFGQLLDKMKRQFELVVVDSPPLGAVTDSMLIANRADEIVYVCRFNRAYRKHIKLYFNTLREGKNEILGVVLNGLNPRRIEYYSNYRYYRSYKKYYGSQT